jgi:hypothetical protein
LFQPVSAENRRRGWVLAQYLVANASRLSIRTVAFDGRVWSAGAASSEGWRRITSAGAGSSSHRASRANRHRDAVHVVVE